MILDWKKIKEQAKEKLNKALDKTEQGLEVIVDKAVEKGQQIHASVQEHGGYIKVAKDTLENVTAKTKALYQNINDSIFTDGEYDSNKVKILLNEGKDLAKIYGIKAGKTLVELSKDVGSQVKTKYYDLVPLAKDLEKYQSMRIGINYNEGILFKPNYEKCIKFIEYANTTIPKNVKNRAKLIEDITVSASENAGELRNYYAKPDYKPAAEEWEKLNNDITKYLNPYFSK